MVSKGSGGGPQQTYQGWWWPRWPLLARVQPHVPPTAVPQMRLIPCPHPIPTLSLLQGLGLVSILLLKPAPSDSRPGLSPSLALAAAASVPLSCTELPKAWVLSGVLHYPQPRPACNKGRHVPPYESRDCVGRAFQSLPGLERALRSARQSF